MHAVSGNSSSISRIQYINNQTEGSEGCTGSGHTVRYITFKNKCRVFAFHFARIMQQRTRIEIQGAYTRSPMMNKPVMSEEKKEGKPCTSICPFITI